LEDGLTNLRGLEAEQAACPANTTSRIEVRLSLWVASFVEANRTSSKQPDAPESENPALPSSPVDMARDRLYDVAPAILGKTAPSNNPMRVDVLRVQRVFVVSVLALLVSTFAHPQDVGTLTLLESTPLRVIRGTSAMQGVEGMKLRPGDILETGPAGAAQAQLEFAGGAIVELGPSTQVYLLSQTGSTANLVLLSGWLKGETTAGSYVYSSPLASATTKGGNILLHALADSADIFVEHGVASVSGGGGAAMPSSADKVFFTHKAGKLLTPAARPSKDFIAGMPIPFRDVLPSRMEKFSGKKPPTPKVDHEVSYTDIERWLMLPTAWRRSFATRFSPRLHDSAFRQAISDHIGTLPEWGPYLHPEDQKANPTADKSSSPSGE
jgi:hypothetical protein